MNADHTSIVQRIQRSEFIPGILLILSIITYCIVFSYTTLMRHWSYYSTYFDLGCFEQGLWTTLHGSFFWNSPHDASQFGVHNSPILFLLIPVYYLFPHAETLLILQTILLAAAAIPLFFIGGKYLGAWSGLAFSLIYLLYPALHGLNLFDFHEMAFLPLILCTAMYYLLTHRMGRFVALSIVALMIKEDVSLLLIMITGYAIYARCYETEVQKKALCILIAIYAIWLIASLAIVIPHFNPQGYLFTGRYIAEGGLSGMVNDNFPLKIVYLVLLFAPLGFTPLAAPEVLITAVPSLAEILFQSIVAYRITTQYSALLIPVLFTSAILGTSRVVARLTAVKPGISRWVVPGLLALGLLSSIFCTPAPVSPFTLYYKFSPNSCQYVIDEHTTYLEEAIRLIPADASVSAQNNLAGHLSQRNEIYLNYRPGVDNILVDTKNSNVDWLGNSEIIIPAHEYSTVYERDGISLYAKRNR